MNGIGNAADIPYSKEQVAKALEALGMSATIRGEALTLQEFATLSDELGRA